MPAWVGFIIALGVLALLAPGVAWLAWKHGRSVKGGAALAVALLGLGAVIDPPRRHMIESIEGEEQDTEATGEPKDATSGS